MLASSIPTKFQITWASAAGSSYINTIPTASQISANPGFASLTDGFPPLNATQVSAGGIPPRIQDWNGILKEITQWNQWQQAGGPITYDATFQSAIGGYPSGAIIQSATTPGLYWRSTADSNTTNPDAGGAGWANFLPYALLAGSVTQPFSVGNATAASNAVNLGQFPSSLTTNGWKKWPDSSSPSGYSIEQWGTSSSTSGGTTITFPIAFPSYCLNVVATNGPLDAAAPVAWPGIGNLSAASFLLWQSLSSGVGANSVSAFWRAIGY